MNVFTEMFLRVFHAEFPFSGLLGTIFTIEVDKKQYIITSGHALEGIKPIDTIRIQSSQKWHSLTVKLAGMVYNKGVLGADIGVLVVDEQLVASNLQKINLGTGNLLFGQDVIFLGFPFGMNFNLANIPNANFPAPLIKRAILSGFANKNSSTGTRAIYLDGHNNVGFSGGPAFAMVDNAPKLFGVVTSFLREKVDENVSNSGIMVCADIQMALDIIESNPIGFHLID